MPSGSAGERADADVVLTLDIDWAPDVMVERLAAHLVEAGVRATWYVTHESPVLELLRRNPDLFELGIHPNFAANSTQGDTPLSVLHHCMAIVPEARSMRTHGLFYSSRVLDVVVAETPVENDVSMFLPRAPRLEPCRYERPQRDILRVPYVWGDDYEMERRHPEWKLESILRIGRGLKILDFHPVHVAMNSTSLASYELLKQEHPLLHDMSSTAIDTWTAADPDAIGAGTLFDAVVAHLAATGGGRRVSDVVAAAASCANEVG